MLKKRLTKHGNSLALVIDKPILEMLGIDGDTELSLQTDGDALLIRRAETHTLAPETADERRARIRAISSKVMSRFDATLRRLAQ